MWYNREQSLWNRNYEWYWRNACDGIEFNAFLISSFIDSISNAVNNIFEFIKQYDPGYYQGYLFAKPLSIGDLESFMKEYV